MKTTRRTVCLLLLLVYGDIESHRPMSKEQSFDADMGNIAKHKGIKIFHLNVCGSWNNLAHITYILSSHRNIDIFSTTETHITDEPGELYNVEGYYFVHKNRKQGKGGGVAF